MEPGSQAPPAEQHPVENSNKSFWKTLAIGMSIVSFCIAIAAGGYLLVASKSSEPKQVSCTMEAKLCPDGSSVGRSGPNCEFALCPTPTPTPDETAEWKTYQNNTYKFSFLYPNNWGKINSYFGEFENLNVLYEDTIGKTERVGIDVSSGLTIKVLVIDSEKSYTDLAQEKLTEAKGWGYDENPDSFKLSSIKIGSNKNIPAAVVSFPGLTGNDFIAAYIQLNQGETVILYGIHPINSQESINQFYQILSTFKFTN